MQEMRKNIAIGILTCAAIALVTWSLLFLHPSHGDGEQLIRVRFTNIDKIVEGTPVTFAGQPIGEVIAINMVPEARASQENDSDQIFSYELTLAVDSHVDVYDTDIVSIRTSGLMGERNISILPKRTSNGASKKLKYNELIYSSPAGSVEDAFANFQVVVKKAEKTMDEIIDLLDENQGEVAKTLHSIESASSELYKLLKQANDSKILDSASATTTSLQASADRINLLTQRLEKEHVIENLGSSMRRLDQIAAAIRPDELQTLITSTSQSMDQLQVLLSKISSGEGSIGKMVVDDDFYLKSVATLNKVNILMNDVNQYGVLFHLDKGWQRERRKRVEEVANLQSPKQFKSYLESEMQSISLAMQRVNMALEKANTATAAAPTPENLLETRKEFSRAFVDLLGEVQSLEGTLKGYCGTDSASIDTIANSEDK